MQKLKSFGNEFQYFWKKFHHLKRFFVLFLNDIYNQNIFFRTRLLAKRNEKIAKSYG